MESSIGPLEPKLVQYKYVLHVPVAFAFDGWIRFEGSSERMFFGPDCHWDVGDKVKITFERTTYAQPR